MGPTYNDHTMIVNQSLWSRLRSAAASRRSRIVIAALIMFLASAALALHPDWHVASSKLRVPGLHHPSSKTTPSDNSEDDGQSRPDTAVLSPDEDSVLLSAGNPSFSSPNGRYILALQPDGDVVLSHKDVDGTFHPLWWTGTGDRHSGGRTVSVESRGGRLRVAVNAMLKNTWVTVWHSDLEPACKQAPAEGIAEREQAQSKGMLKKTPGQLELSNDGKLTIAGLCDLRVPPVEREKTRSLAVIVAGLYRTNHVTCKTHMAELVDGHPSFTRIDVFAYMLYEPADENVHKRSKESIEAELRACYGAHLRSVDVVPMAEAEEEYPGGEVAMLAPCGQRLRRLNNQLRTVSLAAQKWWAWTVANGFTHDTVLRIRPDTSFWTRPDFKSLEELGDSLVLPHPRGEHYFYCSRMSGRVGVGPTDQIAYGSAATMNHWLYMHDRFAQMVDLAANPSRPAMRDFSGCEDMPTGPEPGDCPRPAPCSIECLVAWYLEARGVDFRVEWGWEQSLLRWIDIGPVGAEEERITDQDDADDGMKWG